MRSLVHFCRFFLRLDPPQSQVTDRELGMLLDHAKDVETVCEIGCFEGRTCAAMAEVTKGTVYSVDPFVPGRLGICYGQWIADTHVRRKGLKNVKLLRGFSADVAPSFDRSIDLLFIDANHSYAAVKQDWDLWSPKVREGGCIAMHDCKPAANSPAYLGSMKFYEEDVPRIPLAQEVDSVDSLVVLKVRRG
jgi:predicted O-methyltransferase YrrM